MGDCSVKAPLRLREVMLLSRHLHLLYGAGTDLKRTFRLLGTEGATRNLRRVALEIGEQLEAGRSLGGSVLGCGARLPMLFASMVAIGERTGRLGLVLENLARHYEEMLALQRELQRQISYPLSVVGGIVIGIPLLRAVLLSATGREDHLLREALMIILPPLLCVWLAVVLGRRIGSFARVQRGTRRLFRRVWFFGTVLRRTATARFAWAMEVMYASGFDPVQAVGFATQATQHPFIMRKLADAGEALRQGSTLTEALGASGVFPAVTLSYIEQGERTGKLDEAFRTIARDEFASAMFTVRNVLAGLEAALILLLGIAIIFGFGRAA